jgi:hypothetical protein
MILASLVDSQAFHRGPDEIDLSHVYPGADLKVMRRGGRTDRGRATEGRSSPVEHGEDAVARRLHLTASEPVELVASRLKVARKHLSSCSVAEFRSRRRRLDEIRKE